jgi:hypothetical protein
MLIVSFWLAAFYLTKSLLCNDAFYQGFNYFLSLHFRVMFLEDSAHIPSKSNRIPCIHPDDMIFRPDAQLSNHHPSGRRELSVQTFLCVEKIQTALGSIRPDVSATQPDAFRCLTREGFRFKTQIWEDSWNHSYDVCSCPDAILDKASRTYKVQPSGRSSLNMVIVCRKSSTVWT